MIPRGAFRAAALALAVALPAAQAGDCTGARVEIDALIRVPVTISGHPARLALDPIGRVLLDREFVAGTGIETVDSLAAGFGPEARIGGAGGEEQVPRFAMDQQLSVAGLERALEPVIVVDLRGPLGGPLADLDGLLGTELFAGRVLDLDLPGRCLELVALAEFRPPDGVAEIPVERMRNRPVVPARMTLPDGETVQLDLLLDFGMSGTLRVSTRVVDALGLAGRLETEAPERAETGLGGRLESLQARVPRLAVGPSGQAGWSDVPITLARETEGADADPPWDALIGIGLLRDRRVLYDPAGNRLWLVDGDTGTR
ncbi:MAG: hypothetical protein R3323_01705 [Wenzhouxiangellaceae bacterium]|nr:hypothetical protein [Wenzhouxiangellaceae bacterium]